MRRVEAIRTDPLFCTCMERIEAAEADRAFCRHGLPHLLDVARIAWILALERGLGLDRGLVYAAALLHDIGRAEQYATGEDHDVAGVRIAAAILGGLPEGHRFCAAERAMILRAVAGHRGACAGERPAVAACDAPAVAAGTTPASAEGPRADDGACLLARLIQEADARSRACYACHARAACYWPDGRKNLSLDI